MFGVVSKIGKQLINSTFFALFGLMFKTYVDSMIILIYKLLVPTSIDIIILRVQ